MEEFFKSLNSDTFTRQYECQDNTEPRGCWKGGSLYVKHQQIALPLIQDCSSHTQTLKGVHTPLMTPLQRFPSNHTRSTCAASKQRAHPLTLIIMVKSPLAGR